MPRRERVRLLLRGLAKLVAVIVVAGLIGVVLGIGLSMLGGDDEPSAPVTPATTTTTSTTRTTTTATTAATATTTTTQAADDQIQVTVGTAVLHLASAPAGERRNRARLGVRATVRNRGSQRVVLPRPSLLAARQRVATNPAADGPDTHLEAVSAGQTQQVTLQFETAGAVTEQLATQKRARVLIGERSSAITVTLGPPVSRRAPSATNAP